jgi:hypothetical protein
MIRAAGQCDLLEGERRKDEGIGVTTDNYLDWMANAIYLVDVHAPHDRHFMAEEFRAYPGIGSPKSPNSWGALTNLAVRRRIIEKVPNTYSKSSSVRNHAHEYKVYRRRKY